MAFHWAIEHFRLQEKQVEWGYPHFWKPKNLRGMIEVWNTNLLNN
jgi:hypothetical protein